MHTAVLLALLFALAWLARVAAVWRRGRSARPVGGAPVRTLVVMGSGGHTAEMLALLRTLDRRKYAPLLYVIAASDHTSARRVATFESERAVSDGLPLHQMLTIPRSREVRALPTGSLASPSGLHPARHSPTPAVAGDAVLLDLGSHHPLRAPPLAAGRLAHATLDSALQRAGHVRAHRRGRVGTPPYRREARRDMLRRVLLQS